MHKFAFGKQPESFHNMFIPLGKNNRSGNYFITNYKLKLFDQFPTAFLPKVWNNNSNEIKNCLSIKSIKTLPSEKLISHYNLQEKCNYIQCPDCQR